MHAEPSLSKTPLGRFVLVFVIFISSFITDSIPFDINNTVLLCNNTHVCDESEYQSYTSACNCDVYCNFFNDCCKDVSYDKPSTFNTYPGLAELEIGAESIGCITPVLSNLPASYGDYFSPPFYYEQDHYFDNEDVPLLGLFMIDRCSDVSSEFALKCREHNATDMQSAIPVTEVTYGISFKNIYCALCHKVSSKDLLWWKLLAQCDLDILPLIQDGLTYGISLSETLRVINQYCPISFGHPSALFTSDIGTRRCYRQLVGPESCGPGEFVERCHENYTAYVTDDSGVVYRNPYCYLCSQSYFTDDYEVIVDCYNEDIPLIYIYSSTDYYGLGSPVPRDPMQGFVPISVIVDFSSNSGVSVKVLDTVISVETVDCAEGQVYDPFVERCRALSCPEGFSLFVDECIRDTSGCVDDLLLTLDVSYANCKDSIDNYTKQCIETTLVPAQFITTSTKHECGASAGDNIGHFSFQVKSTKYSILDLEQILDCKLESREDYLNRCNSTDVTLQIVCSSEWSKCVDRLSLSNVSIESSNNNTFIVSQNTKYLFSGGMLTITYKLSTEWTKSVNADICNVSHFSCTLVTLNASLFTNVSNDNLLYQPTGELFTYDEYIFTPDGQIQVCSFFDRNGTRNSTQTITFLAYDEIQIILSLIGCIISLIALLVTFITFCVFAHLRTRAIKAIMNLVIALFTAQLVFLIGAGNTSNPNVCTFIAVLLHYLWISTFTWSNVLAYDLNKTFSSKMSASYQERNAPIFKYILYGWLTPVIVIVPCLVVDLCDCTDIEFQYGTRGTCWIYNQYANLVAFGGPLVLCLMINIVLFFRTTRNIHKTKQNTKMVQKKNSTLKNISEELLIYIKVNSIL